MIKYGNNQYLTLVNEGNVIVRTWRTYAERKHKNTGYIFIPGSQFCHAEVKLKLRSFLHDSAINSAAQIVNVLIENVFIEHFHQDK